MGGAGGGEGSLETKNGSLLLFSTIYKNILHALHVMYIGCMCLPVLCAVDVSLSVSPQVVGEFDFVSAYNSSGVLTTVYTPVGKAEQVRALGCCRIKE